MSVTMNHALPVSEAASYIEKQAKRVLREAPGVRDGTVDGVHDMRVASRRLRVALREVAPVIGKDVTKPLAKRMNRVTETLGHARELDVMLIMTKSYQKNAEGLWKISAKHAVQELKAIRLEALKECDGVVQAVEDDSFQQELDNVLSALEGHDSESLPPVGEKLVRRFRIAREAYRDWCESEDPQHLHSFRIVLKKLRYAIEFYDPAYDNQMAQYLKRVKVAQDLTGDWHDAHVLCDALERIGGYAPYDKAQGFPLMIESFDLWGGQKVEELQDWARKFFVSDDREVFLAYCTEGE